MPDRTPLARLPAAPAATWMAAAALSLTLLAPPPARAQAAAEAPPPAPTASQPMSKGEAKAISEFNLLDVNGDGKLSRKEVAIIPSLAAAFDEADTNHDNYVTLDEVRAFTVKYRAERDRARAAAQAQESAGTPPPGTAAPRSEKQE